MINGITLEICIGNIEDALRAASFDEVDRIEVNSALESDGLTPSLATLRLLREATTKKILCMVRPRKGGFHYTESEKQTMLADAEIFLGHGADGIVFGSLNKDRTVDTCFTKKMVSLIRPYGKEAVFHKAFDVTPDPFLAAEELSRMHVTRILTSGQMPSVPEGIDMIRQLNTRFKGKIEILAGGGVNAENVCDIIHQAGLSQIHLSAKKTVHDLEDYYAVSEDEIRHVIARLHTI